MTTSFDPAFLTARDAVDENGSLRINGPLISDSTNFAVRCLNLPQTADMIRAVAGIDVPTYDQYADILSKLASVFVRMFRIAESFGIKIKYLGYVCKAMLEYVGFVKTNFPTLFECFRELRDNPTSEIQDRLHQLNLSCVLATNNVARAAQDFGFESEVSDWTAERQYVDEIFEAIETRSRDPKLQAIIKDVLKFKGEPPSDGLENLKDWIKDLDEKSSKAMADLKLFRGSWHVLQTDAQELEKFAYEPHSESTDRFMRVELAGLLEGWENVKVQVNELRKNNLDDAIDSINRNMQN